MAGLYKQVQTYLHMDFSNQFSYHAFKAKKLYQDFFHSVTDCFLRTGYRPTQECPVFLDCFTHMGKIAMEVHYLKKLYIFCNFDGFWQARVQKKEK